MAGISDAQQQIDDLFKKLSTGDDAEQRVDEIEQLAQIAKILDGNEPEPKSTTAEPEGTTIEPAGDDVKAEPETVAAAASNALAVPAGAAPAVSNNPAAEPVVEHPLRYRVAAEEGQKRPESKNQLGAVMANAFATLKRSASPGSSVSIVNFKAAGVDVDETGQVAAEVESQRVSQVIARSATRIATLARMSPLEAAARRVQAGAGFCAPPVPRHEYCEVDALAGIVDFPTFTMPPSGVRLPAEPNLMPIYDNLHCLTEAEEIAREEPKPCWTIECTDFRDITGCLLPMCIEVGTLTRWANPELVDKVLAEALKKYEQFINASNLFGIANSTGTVSVDFTGMLRTGALNDIISATLIIASQYRTKWRLDPSSPIRWIAPDFVADVLASDGSRRAQDPEMLGLARAVIETTLAKHAIDVTWAYDWQDAQSIPDPNGWGGTGGGATPEARGYKTAWPESADILMFAPDTWQEYRQELIRVQGLRQESTLMRDNKELALFLESVHATVNRCKETVKLTVPLCPAGTQQIQDWDGTTCPI